MKVKVSPHTGLAGHKLDFIELDGSVSLSLVVDEATVDAANGGLSWAVVEQPWEDGDKLMVRIREAPLRPPPAAPVAPVLSNNDLPLSAQQDATTPIAMSRSNSVYGPTTFEERAIRSDLVIRARLQSKAVSSRWEQSNSLGRKVYFPFVDFTFEVLEVIRGSAGNSVVVELKASKPFYPQFGEGLNKTAAESEQRARDWLASDYYDSQWEGRDAILFLMDIAKTERYGMGGRPANVQYAFVGHTGKEATAYNGGDGFSIASEQNKAWLPATEVTAGASTFYLESPDTDGDASTSSLSSLKSSVTTAASQIDTSKDGYQECLVAKKYDERESTERDVLRVEVTIESGLPTGTIVADRVGLGSNTYWYYHLYGDDAVYFDTSVVDADDNPENGYDGSTRTVRPLPAGQYALEEARQLEVMVPCGYIPDERVHWTINVAAPEGTLHELFFDPVTVGSTVAADGTNGVLKTASFTDANGASATIHRIEWESGTVEVEVTPDDALVRHVVDIIELDGSVSLSLVVDEATVDAANGGLSWAVVEQPWEDGDKLMVRIREAPLRPPPAAPVAPVLSNNDLPLSAQQDATTPIAMSRSNSVYGPTTFEERAIRSDLVIRARLQSKAVSSRWEQSNSLGRKVYFPSVDFTFEVLEPVFPIWAVSKLKGQSKRDSGIIVRSCKASQSPVYPIRDAFLAVNHASCPSLSSRAPRQWGESALKTSRLPGALSLLARSWLYPPSAWRRR